MADDTRDSAPGTVGVPAANFDHFKGQADALYQQIRDENREVAVLLLAKALGDAYFTGQRYVIDRQLLALTPDAPTDAAKPDTWPGWGPAGALKRHS